MSSPAPSHRAEGFELLGYTDLDGRPGFKLALQVTGGRWWLYVTRFWEPGVWIVDVTDPTSPAVVDEIPGPDDPNVATWQVQVADGLLVLGLEHRPLPWGGDPTAAGAEGLEFWDVADPTSPRRLSGYAYGGHGTHRNHYTGGNLVHVTASVPGFEGNIYSILDIEDPARPREVGRWFLPEQWVAGTAPGAAPGRRISLHGPPYPHGDRAYLPYGAAGMVVLDISDVRTPRLVSRLDIGGAFSSMIAMHTAIPLPGRGLVAVNTEAIAERSEEAYNFAGLVDVTDEREPRLVSLLPVPVPPDGADFANFQRRGGRFGPHNQHHPQNGAPHLFQSEDLLYLTWFNAGLRVYDISDPYLPRERGWFLPDDPVERRGLLPRGALVTQSEDVLVDNRGVAYLTDKNHGLHVLRFTG
ncbi:LVIVD repeat-containing protein [Egicoccus sp. AB-alg6-2]|uniref:LVIVD repeat-containing protein n=1 Tax=Egicoccus sp. AB-alg6-2 TaxID=3242692 RepID=UPI00359D46C5